MKNIVVGILVLVSFSLRSNPLVRGTWTGYIIQGTQDNPLKLPCTFYINEANDNGTITGEILISYKYKDGKDYFCKARFSGNVDYTTYDFSLVMEEYIYYDLLPEGMKWCLGTFSGSIRREMELKEYLILATLKTYCTEELSDVILVKQQ
jgi:hypothetical protein